MCIGLLTCFILLNTEGLDSVLNHYNVESVTGGTALSEARGQIHPYESPAVEGYRQMVDT